MSLASDIRKAEAEGRTQARKVTQLSSKASRETLSERVGAWAAELKTARMSAAMGEDLSRVVSAAFSHELAKIMLKHNHG